MTEKLMPCPFCGGPAMRKDDPGVVDVPFGLVVYHAPGCFLAMPFCTNDEAIDRAWNTRHPTPAADEVEAVARVLAVDEYADRHGINPVQERIEGTDHFEKWFEQSRKSFERPARAAIAALQARSAEPAGEEPVAWDKLAEIGITSWRQACEWMIELDETHVGDGETEIIEGLSAIRKALLSAPATPTNPERLVEARMGDCPSSPDGRHQVDTSMESGPNNCFYCEAPMPALSAAPLKEGSHDV